MDVEYTPNSSVSNLHIKDVEVTDEGLYKCEKTYLEVRENCDVVQVIKLRTLGKSSVVKPSIYTTHIYIYHSFALCYLFIHIVISYIE